MPPQISYLQIVSENPDRLAQFYLTHFGFAELGRSDDGDVAVSDGFYNLSLLKRRAGAEETGRQRFGIAIEDIRDIEGRLEEFAPEADLQPDKGDLFHGEYRMVDPHGTVVSLSTKHFNTGNSGRQFPTIRHFAMCVPNNDEVLDFYINVFGFVESDSSRENREQGRLPARWAVDGSTGMAILPTRAHRAPDPTESMKDGPNHFGILVHDLAHYERTLPEGSVSKRPDSVRGTGQRRPFAEFRVFDPDRNPFDLCLDEAGENARKAWLP